MRGAVEGGGGEWERWLSLLLFSVVSSKVLDPHHSVTTSSGALGTVVRLGGAVLGFKRPHFYFFVFINVTAICF